MPATFNIPCSSSAVPSIGSAKIQYVSFKDIALASTWWTRKDDTCAAMNCECDDTKSFRFRFGHAGKYIEARQRMMLVPVNRMVHMSYSVQQPEPEEPKPIGPFKWTGVITLYPTGKPDMVKLVYPTGSTMVARKILEIASVLWNAYYGKSCDMRKLAGEIMMGIDNLCCSYDPLHVTRGTRPIAISDMLSRKIEHAMKWIDSELNKKSEYIVNDLGDIILYLWWLSGEVPVCE